MAIVPEYVYEILRLYRQEVEVWFMEQWYTQLLRQTPGHILVRVQQHVDLRGIEQVCSAYRHHSGAGCQPSYRIAVLVRALLVKYVDQQSLRQTEKALRQDLLVKWFVGLRPLEPVPDHTTLYRFERWVRTHQPRLYFRTVLEQIDQDFPAEGGQVQIGDTFAMHARAAQEGLVRRLRHTSRCLWREVGYGPAGAGPAWQAVFGAADEPNWCYLNVRQREARQETTVRGVWQLLQQLRPWLPGVDEPHRARGAARLAELEKILRDTYQLICDVQGQLQQVQRLAESKQGDYQIYGANDPQATLRNHGGKQVLGYNIALSITPRGIIREIQAATGAEPDQAAVARLLEQQRQHGQPCPHKLLFDQAASAGRTRAQVRQVSAGQTQLVARLTTPTTGARFGPEAFSLEPSGTQLTCPQQRVTKASFRASDRDGRIFEFRARACGDCPVWTACRDPAAKPDGPRRVFISDYQEEIRQAQAYNQSQSFAAEMKLRPLVERTILMLTHYDGLRQAQGCGRACADFQAKMGATARNLRTWLPFHEAFARLPAPADNHRSPADSPTVP